MSKEPDLSWAEVSKLIAAEGSGDHLSARVRRWREERGWSLAQLAIKLNAEPYRLQIDRSSIFKLEKEGGRRRIAIDEAIAIAGVFDKTLAEVLLPDHALEDVQGWQKVIAAAEALNAVRAAWAEYKSALRRAQHAVSASPALRARAESAQTEQRTRFADSFRKEWPRYKVRVIESGEPEPDDEQFKEFVSWQMTTPLIATLEDVLEGRQVAEDGWAAGRTIQPRTEGAPE